jgi:pimeloyl-ACP methyl ester carboxylesterase
MGNMMLGVLSLLLVLSLCRSMPMSQKQQAAPDPDCLYNITQMIESKGYPYEEHKVITPDGYILGVYRIPHGRNTQATTPGRPVLLQHGLLDSGATWVMNFADQSLGFILADAGYDVWIGNVRGNRYSRAHVKYDPNHDEAFWDFSFDEMANIDFPSMVYYILNVTQQTKIAYVGHSQGTMMGFAQFSNPDSVVERNVSFWVALAPVAHLGHIKSPLRYLSTATVQKDLELYWHLLFGKNEFLPSDFITKWLGEYACSKVIIDRAICENIFFVLFGPEKKNLNETRMPVYVAHVPDGTSVKNMIHFAQGVQSNLFEAYEYGSLEKNQEHYNQTIPPAYPIRPMTVPTAIFSGGEDWLADPTDANYIFDQIQSQTLVFRKFIPDYNHMDFVWGITANKLIYPDLLDQMKKYHPAN